MTNHRYISNNLSGAIAGEYWNVYFDYDSYMNWFLANFNDYDKDINTIFSDIYEKRQSYPDLEAIKHERIKDILLIYSTLVERDEIPTYNPNVMDRKYPVEKKVAETYGCCQNDVETVLWTTYYLVDKSKIAPEFIAPKEWKATEKMRERPEYAGEVQVKKAFSSITDNVSNLLFYGKILLIVGGSFWVLNQSGIIDKSLSIYKNRKKK